MLSKGLSGACSSNTVQRHQFFGGNSCLPLEGGMAPPSSILAWRIPWTEEPGGLQSMGLQSQSRECCTKEAYPLCSFCAYRKAFCVENGLVCHKIITFKNCSFKVHQINPITMKKNLNSRLPQLKQHRPLSPNSHFRMSTPAFEKTLQNTSGIIPVSLTATCLGMSTPKLKGKGKQ